MFYSDKRNKGSLKTNPTNIWFHKFATVLKTYSETSYGTINLEIAALREISLDQFIISSLRKDDKT